MRRFLFTLFLTLTLTLLITGCSSNGGQSVSNNEAVDIEEVQEGTTEEADEEETTDTEISEKSIGSTVDVEYIPIDQYEEENWYRIETDRMMEQSALLDKNTFYIHNQDHEVISYTEDMEENWKVKLPYSIARRMVMTEKLLLINIVTQQGEEGYIEALDKKTGKSVYQIDLTAYNDLSSILVIDEAMYFFVGESTDPSDAYSVDKVTFHKYDLKDGSQVWEKELENFNSRVQSYYKQIPHNDSTIFAVSDESELLALDMDTGDEMWKQELSTLLSLGTPFVSQDVVYLFDQDHNFLGFDAKTGEEIVEYSFPGDEHNIQTEPVFKDSIVIYHNYLAPDEDDQGMFQLIAADLEKKEVLWSFDLDEDFTFDTRVIDDTLYVLTASMDEDPAKHSKVLKLKPETGEVIEAIELNERMYDGPGTDYIYARSDLSSDFIGFFYEHTAYFIK